MLNRPEEVHAIINTLRTLRGVEEIRIYNKQGIISYSTDTTEILKKLILQRRLVLAVITALYAAKFSK